MSGRGPHRTTEEVKAIVEKVEKMIAEGVSSKEATASVGLPLPTFYSYRMRLNGKKTQPRHEATPESSAGYVGITFDVVAAEEAKTWVANRSGRFGAFKDGLMAKLTELRRTEAVTFKVPPEADKKEVIAIHSACAGAIKKSGLDYTVRYSRAKNLFVVMRRNRLAGKGE